MVTALVHKKSEITPNKAVVLEFNYSRISLAGKKDINEKLETGQP
jgi:hypothetical protein